MNPVNVAVFKYKQLDKVFTATVPSTTFKDDAIINGLKNIEEIKNISPHALEIIEIYSEWKPSEEVLETISENYPNVKISYSFEDGDEEKFKSQLNRKLKKPWWKFWQ